MKTRNVVKYLIILSFILSSSNVISEESGDIYIGLLGGAGHSSQENVSYKMSLLFDPEYPEYCNCLFLDIFEDKFIGGNLDYLLFSNEFWSHSANLGLSYKNSKLSSGIGGAGYEFITRYDDSNSSTGSTYFTTQVRYDLSLVVHNFDIDFLYKLKFNTFVQFGFSIGPYVSIPYITDAYEVYNIVKPNKQLYTQEQLKLDTIPEQKIHYEVDLNENPFYWGFKTNFFLEYEFNQLIRTTAGIGFTIPQTNFLDDPAWKIRNINYFFMVSYKL
jgi:hypothetical protein